MTIIDKILNEWTFRCHDGIVDINNSEKLNILNEILEEWGFTELLINEAAKNTIHFDKRLQERGKILDITNLNQIPLKDYDIEEVKNRLKTIIQQKLNDQADKLLKKDIPQYSVGSNAIRMLKPVLIVNNKSYDLRLYAISTKIDKSTGDIREVKNYGNLYVAVINNNALTTLILMDDADDTDLYFQIKHHIKRKKDEDDVNIDIYNQSDLLFEIDLDELMTGNKIKQEIDLIDIDTLPYKVRTDYRKDSKFEHKTLGTGIVVNTSSGAGGKGDSRGMIDWVDVKYPKPFLKNGKFTDIRRFEKIYTLVSPSLKK